MPKTLDSYLADRALTRQIYLMRFSAGEKKKVLAVLVDMRAELVAKLRAGNVTDFTRQRLQRLLTQCGDGTIYRASGFFLTGLKVNNQIWAAPSGEVTTGRLLEQVFSRTSLTDGRSKQQQQQAKNVLMRTSQTKANNILETGAASMKIFKEAGWKPKEGFQGGAAPTVTLQDKRPKQAMASDQGEQRQGSTDPDAPIQNKR